MPRIVENMELNDDFSHEHPLILSVEKFNKFLECTICCEPIVGLCFCCTQCPYALHKHCSDLPRVIQKHQLHPEHTLVLLQKVPSQSTFNNCGFCKIARRGFVYSCKVCDFVLHLGCASKSIWVPSEALKEKFHDLFYQSMCYSKNHTSCVICRDTCEGIKFFNYVCSVGKDNNNYFHIQCGMLPKFVKHPSHLHILTLNPPLEKDLQYDECYCDACETERDPLCWVYYCDKCEFVAHASCGITSGLDPPAKDIIEKCPVYRFLDEMKNEEIEKKKGAVALDLEIDHAIEKENSRRKERKKEKKREERQFKYFNHPHPLVMYDEEFNLMVRCKVCDVGIYGKTYICKKCGFYLHKRCAELPRKILHPLHPEHLLTLTLKHDNYCKYCAYWTSGSAYVCKKCRVARDPFLDMAQSEVKHDSHEHPLTAVIHSPYTLTELRDSGIVKQLEYPIYCSFIPPCHACGFPCMGLTLECHRCGFYIHIICSLLPRSGKHDTHRHALILKYSFEEDLNALEFFCDACETERTPNRWVYCCPDPKCSIVAHTECVFPKLFGG